jgi:hypothetical protein
VSVRRTLKAQFVAAFVTFPLFAVLWFLLMSVTLHFIDLTNNMIAFFAIGTPFMLAWLVFLLWLSRRLKKRWSARERDSLSR